MPSTYLVSGLPQTALIVIDVQQAFIDPSFLKRERSTPNMKPNIIALLAVFRTMGLPVITSTQRSSIPRANRSGTRRRTPRACFPKIMLCPRLGSPFCARTIRVRDSRAHLVTDGITGLKDVLDAQGIKTIILVGQSSPHCVSSTARAGFDLGLSVVVVGDACATYAAGISDFSGAAPGGGGEGKASSAETVHGVAMAHLDGDLADVVGTAEVLKCL